MSGYRPDNYPKIYLTGSAVNAARDAHVEAILAEPHMFGTIDIQTHTGAAGNYAHGPLFSPENVLLLISNAGGHDPEPRFIEQDSGMRYYPEPYIIGSETEPLIIGKGALAGIGRQIVDVPVRDFEDPSYSAYLALGSLEQSRIGNPMAHRIAARLLGFEIAGFLLGRPDNTLAARAADIGKQHPDALRPHRPDWRRRRQQ